MNTLVFTSIAKHKPGAIFSLLRESYALIWNDKLEETMRKFDCEVFENPRTVGACTFITCLDGQPIGLASYDPRLGPESAIIGHNCILPDYQGRGFGRQQIAEILLRLRAQGFAKVTVTTSDHPFFIPAQKMYQACGFREVRRLGQHPDQTIEYEIDLK